MYVAADLAHQVTSQQRIDHFSTFDDRLFSRRKTAVYDRKLIAVNSIISFAAFTFKKLRLLITYSLNS